MCQPGGTLRVASWPSSKSSPLYYSGFYGALAPYGVRLVIDGLPVSDAELKARHSDFDVLHVHWPEDLWRLRGHNVIQRLRGVIGLWRYLTQLRESNIRLWWTVHNLTHHEGSQFPDSLGYRVLLHFAEIVIVHSQVSATALRRRYQVASEKVLVIPIGNAAGFFSDAYDGDSIKRRFGLRPDYRTLLCLGGLRRYKGFDIAVRAVASSKEPYQLVVAGGPDADPLCAAELRSMAGELPNVHLLPETLDDQTVSDLHLVADCVLLPYRQITTSAALLTALTFGRGVVVSDLPYFREILSIEPGAGELSRDFSPTALLDALKRFFNVDLAEREAAANRLAAQFDWDRVIRPLVSRLGLIR